MLETICSAASGSSVPVNLFNNTLTVCLASSERLSICLHQSAKLLKVMGSFGFFSDIKYSEVCNGVRDTGMDNRNTFVPGAFQAYTSGGAGTGILEIDFAELDSASYISKAGTAEKDTLLTGLVHELRDGLTGRKDNVTNLDYKGDNVKFVNQIYKELGLPQQVSYIAYDRTGKLHKLNYHYIAILNDF